MALLHVCVCILVLSIAPTSHSGTLSAGMYTVVNHDVKLLHDVNATSLVSSTTTAKPAHPVRTMEGRVCGSVDIRNSVAELKRQLQGCKVVEGYVQISLIDHANESDYENVSFPELREITCYLILYRVRGLRNLGHLFPNLTVIRGNTLFTDYALVVYEMNHLQELGLWELTAILRGSVRIEKNPSLCYVNTVNWRAIIAGGGDYHIESNMDEKSCPSGCDMVKDCDKDMCWGSQQHLCHKIGLHRGCHHECLGGCFGPGPQQCFVCRGVLNDDVCVSNCPTGRYEYLGRSCITEAECRHLRVPHSGHILPDIFSEYERQKGWWPFNGTCIDHCPPGYEEVFNGTVIQGCEPCRGRCSHECLGAEVSSIADAQNLRGCTTINGSLEIYIRGSGSHIIKELEESLSSIEEIQGYLKISRSFPLTSLNFLKKLRIIHGDILEGDKYAFLVIENQNLQELWDWNSRPHNFTIAKGKISFHYNPKLCLREIELLRDIANLPNYTNYDVSRESNGDKVACHVIDLNTTVKVMSSRNVLIEWDPCVLEDVLGYVIYYIEAPEQNVTEHEGLDACSNKGWKIKDISFDSCGNAYQFLPHLEPFTQYAFYMKTYTKSNRGGQTKIQYFRTWPDKPSVPKEIQAYANSSSSIVLDWQPPERPNGILSYYLVFGDWFKDEDYFMGERDYCSKPLVPEPDLSVMHGVAPDMRNVKQAEQCCEKVEAEPIILIKDEDDYNVLCKDKLHNRFEEYGEKDPCQNYFYSFIHDKSEIFDHDAKNYDIDDSILGQKFPVFTHTLFLSAPMQSSWVYLNKSLLNENGVYEKFVEQVDPNQTQILLENLQHFAVYNIRLVVCREPHNEDENITLPLYNETRCSTSGLVTLRTRSLHSADSIENYTVEYNETDEGSVRLKWMEPKMPNGMVLKYRLEWGRADGESFHDECLTREQYLEAQGGFILRNLMPGNYSFRVRATSLAGDGTPTKMFLFHIKNTPPPARLESLIILLLLGIAVLACFVMLFVMWRRKQSKKSVTIIASVNPDYMSAGEIYQEDDWELPSENLKLLKELGQGSFGTVHEAVLYPSDTHCAVKMINESASQREKNEFLNEASMMKSFAGAHHVVKLLGVVSKGNSPLVVMELMARGDLKSYLRKCRDPPPEPPDLDRMLLMAAQIADGMAYLEAHKFVHRDLAARNCMVAEDLTIKIGDFGMTRDIYETDYYRNGSKGLLPVRWMSPESLKDGVFTSQSDVWSLGVVLWEMATLAEQPYQGLANEQVLHFVLGGGFLDRPPRCSDVFYQFMVSCWHRRPSRRPRFLQIVADVEAVQSLGPEFTKLSFYHSKEGQDLKANLDQQDDIEAADDSVFDETFSSCPPVCFYQLMEQDDSIARALSGRSCDDGYVLPGDSASEDDAIPSPSKHNSTDGYVLPNNFPLPCYSGHTLPDISEESESLLPQPVPSHEVPQNAYVPLSAAPSKLSSGIRNLNSQGFVPAAGVSGGDHAVDIFRLEFPQQTSRGSVPNRVPDDNYVPPDKLDTNKCTSANGNSVAEARCTSEQEKGEVPQMRRVNSDQTDTPAEEDSASPKVSTPKLPNGLVNGFVSRPRGQENGNILPFKS